MSNKDNSNINIESINTEELFFKESDLTSDSINTIVNDSLQNSR